MNNNKIKNYHKNIKGTFFVVAFFFSFFVTGIAIWNCFFAYLDYLLKEPISALAYVIIIWFFVYSLNKLGVINIKKLFKD